MVHAAVLNRINPTAMNRTSFASSPNRSLAVGAFGSRVWTRCHAVGPPIRPPAHSAPLLRNNPHTTGPMSIQAFTAAVQSAMGTHRSFSTWVK
jgi:hypothetical protein